MPNDDTMVLIATSDLCKLRAVATRLFSENRMHGDEMRDAAQDIMAVVDLAIPLAPVERRPPNWGQE